MIRLFSGKQGKKPDEAAKAAPKPHKMSAGEMRLQKDLAELSLPSNMSINFPDGEDKMMHFEITIKPDEGIYQNGAFVFDFTIPTGYSHEAPKVLCKTKVYHPNIDVEGKICLNILREDWKPVLTISSIIFGLNFLFVDPNPDDPLNKEAAQMYQDNPRQFQTYVQRAITQGHHINNVYFPPCPASS